MFCLDVETPREEILPALRENLHSRVPVFEGSLDVIVGILYTKDLLAYVATGLPPTSTCGAPHRRTSCRSPSARRRAAAGIPGQEAAHGHRGWTVRRHRRGWSRWRIC